MNKYRFFFLVRPQPDWISDAVSWPVVLCLPSDQHPWVVFFEVEAFLLSKGPCTSLSQTLLQWLEHSAADLETTKHICTSQPDEM